MLKSSGAMAAATLTSRVLGMVREMVYANFMGIGWVTDAFMLAFTIPNLFRRLLGEGALTVAFIPIFKEKEKKQGEVEMWRAANAVISGLIVVTSVIVALGIFGISLALPSVKNAKPQPIVLQTSHPDVGNEAAYFNYLQSKTNLDYDGLYKTKGEIKWERTVLMLELLREMFPYLLLVCVAAAFIGILNARGHFFIPAMGATMLNVVMIASVFWIAPHMGILLPDKIFGLAIGVLLAGIAQASFQLPTLWKDGFRYQWVSPWRDETVGHVVRKMVPGTIGVAAFQINVLVVQGLAFWVGTGIVSSFGYAVRLMELPQGVFGISLATFLLPTLAGLAAEKNFSEFRTTLRHGVAYLILVNLLMSVLLVVLAEPIIRLLFERGKFGPESTTQATLALECLGPSLVAYSLVNVLARAFFALGDTTTPMKISIACLALNLVFALGLVWRFRQGGLGIANTISSAFNVGLLLFALRKKLGRLEMASLRPMFFPLIAGALLAFGLAWSGKYFWETRLGHATLILKIGAVFVPATVAGLTYWLVALAAKIPAAQEITEAVFQKLRF